MPDNPIDRQIDKTYELNFPVARVYAAWVSSDTVIAPATAMDVLAEVGGHYRLIMDLPDFKGRNEGVFRAVEPEQRLCYTWEWNNDGEVSNIDVRFSATPTGCRIDLSHSGFHSDASAERHATGWDSYMAGFEALLKSEGH